MSDSETAFLHFKNRFLIICFCFVMIVFFCVCLFDLRYPIVCLCGLITRSYFLFLIQQLCNTNVCLLPRLSLGIKCSKHKSLFRFPAYYHVTEWSDSRFSLIPRSWSSFKTWFFWYCLKFGVSFLRRRDISIKLSIPSSNFAILQLSNSKFSFLNPS